MLTADLPVLKRTLVIFNPAARGDKAKAMAETVARIATDADVCTTDAPAQARALAGDAVKQGFTTVVAAGGDGTINEVVNGIGEADVSLGILPIGTMNVFAAELGLPTGNLPKCWEIITNGKTRLIDLPRADGHYFVQLGGIGLDAQVVQETSRDFRRDFGPLSYLINAAQIAGRTPPKIMVEADAGVKEGSFVLIGNGRFYGGPFVIFNDARIDDGLLDVLIFKNLGYLDIARYLHGVFFGTHINLPDVEYFQTHRALVCSEDDVPVEVDGELIGQLPMEFGFSERKLKVLAPA